MRNFLGFLSRWLGLLGIIVIILGLSQDPPGIYRGWSGIWFWEPGAQINPQFIVLGFAGILIWGFTRIIRELRRINSR